MSNNLDPDDPSAPKEAIYSLRVVDTTDGKSRSRIVKYSCVQCQTHDKLTLVSEHDFEEFSPGSADWSAVMSDIWNAHKEDQPDCTMSDTIFTIELLNGKSFERKTGTYKEDS